MHCMQCTLFMSAYLSGWFDTHDILKVRERRHMMMCPACNKRVPKDKDRGMQKHTAKHYCSKPDYAGDGEAKYMVRICLTCKRAISDGWCGCHIARELGKLLRF